MFEDFSFSAFNEYATTGISEALKRVVQKGKSPIFVCVGSDLVLGDSLGPLVGTLLKNRNLKSYVYGTLNQPVTAKEVEYAKKHLKLMHPQCVTVAIDAAVGKEDDIGLIRVVKRGLKPGLGVDKNLGVLGDVSIVGIVAEKSKQNYKLFNLTRLNLVYKMAEKIANGIAEFILSQQKTLIAE